MALRQIYLAMKKKLPETAGTVLVMRGRGNDELAPSKELLDDFNRHKEACKKKASDDVQAYQCAWEAAGYESRFRERIFANPASLERLKQLAEDSRERDIYLICYESENKPCHRRLLLDIAEEEFGATVDRAPFIPLA